MLCKGKFTVADRGEVERDGTLTDGTRKRRQMMARTTHSRALQWAFIFATFMTVGATTVTFLAAALHSGSFTLAKLAWPGIYLLMLASSLISLKKEWELELIVASNFIAYFLIWYLIQRLYYALRRRMNHQ